MDVKPVEAGSRVVPFQFDITDRKSYQRCVDQVANASGGIDILVNNAAICFLCRHSPRPFRTLDTSFGSQLECRLLGVQIGGSVHGEKALGGIINISSVQGLATEGRAGAYVASKGALISFTKSLAVDLAPFGILANAIAPGCIHTPMSIIDGVDETETELFKAWYIGQRKIPVARPGQPQEIARVAVFLASEDCSYVTGHTLVADGGLSITF